MKCPICGSECQTISKKEQKVINDLFAQSMYPYIYSCLSNENYYCPKDYISLGEYTEEQIEKLKNRKKDLKNTFLNQGLNQIDTHNWARIAEIDGFTNEILGNFEKSANSYKHASDLLDELCAQFIKMRSHSPVGNNQLKVVSMPDFDNLKTVMTYSQNLKRLALNHYLKQNDLSSVSSVVALIDILIALKQYSSAEQLLKNLTLKVKNNLNFNPVINELNKKLISLKKLDESNLK